MSDRVPPVPAAVALRFPRTRAERHERDREKRARREAGRKLARETRSERFAERRAAQKAANAGKPLREPPAGHIGGPKAPRPAPVEQPFREPRGG